MMKRSPVYGRHGMVASSQPYASEIGLSILKKGGNAVDAAIAVAAALNVTEPCSTGLGGDCFIMHFDAKTKQVSALNGSGRSPSSLTLEKGLRDAHGWNLSIADCVTVPGTAAGWHDAIRKWGTWPLAHVLEPAAKLAEEGFPVSPITAFHWKEGEFKLRRTSNYHELMVRSETGYHTPAAGEIFKNPNLAKVLRGLGEHGKEWFYDGNVGDQIVNIVKQYGGVLEKSDLCQHKSNFPEPVSVSFGELDVFEIPPNGQGIVALMALNILKNLEGDYGKHSSVQHLHPLIEALRLAFADGRHFIADPDAVDIPVKDLLHLHYAKRRSSLIKPDQACADITNGSPVQSSDTVSFQVVDSWGNAVSMVNSNYDGFGTGYVPQGCGFTLQNRGENFSLNATDANVLAGSKRPYHTIIPAMALFRGDLFSSFSVMGGFMQPQGHVQVLVNLIAYKMDPQQALDAPRFCIGKDFISFEEGIEESVIEALKAMGHPVECVPVTGHARALFGRGQIIVKDQDTGVLIAGSDGRGDGCAMGF